ncbi:restriction endonuclease [Vreelandella alkaliphila]|uniref:restriction endonuclease n=1 Tax=Vreelandella alkaliphila TaxID=272774 RepID=UPI000EA254BC|nr:restriction endonuclease [Halomonas alkaliphila]AYF35406.1 restriction endonuclease [Halomonas alkaliphila]
MAEEWFVFQEKIKDHFVSIGADAETNMRIQGVRTVHDIDVLVRTRYLGEDLTWIVEAKHWKSKVTKAQVLTLRSIVDDVGADRGFIVSLAGFQSGALDASKSTNVTLKTFEQLKAHTKEVVESEILKAYKDRIGIIEDRYWSHAKRIRIEYGLRHDLMDFSSRFTGQELLGTARSAIMFAEARKYPIDLQMCLTERKGEAVAHNFQQLINWLNLNLNHFDEKLLEAEWNMYQNGDFNPRVGRTSHEERHTSELMAEALFHSQVKRD